jgi:predicted SnoaL-like aldol condensation-catalyzing enzyme
MADEVGSLAVFVVVGAGSVHGAGNSEALHVYREKLLFHSPNRVHGARMKKSETVREFLQMAATGRAREAFDRFVAPEFRHHNAWFAGDGASLMKAMDENAAQHPDKELTIHLLIEDGDQVATYSHVRHTRDGNGAAVVHIFRFDGEKIVELWDVGQEVPADSPNRNGMF